MEHELTCRAREAGWRRLDELRRDGEVDECTIEEAHDNAEKVWHKLGFDQHDGDEGDKNANVEHMLRAIELEAEVLAAAREAVLSARAEQGMDPKVVDGLLRKLDGHGVTPD